VDAGFRKRSCSNKKLKQNTESTQNHFALAALRNRDLITGFQPHRGHNIAEIA
jgi:hypothetical protein